MSSSRRESFTLRKLSILVDNLKHQIENGCGNLGCVIKAPAVGTNGICRCSPKQMARELRSLADAVEGGDWGRGDWGAAKPKED
jgi:hypothetical protein